MVNLSKRNAPALHALKAGLDAGTLGSLERIEASYHQGWVATKVWGDWVREPRWKWRLQRQLSTAGVAGDLGVHLLDALLFLFGPSDAGRLDHVSDLAAAVEARRAPGPLPPWWSEQSSDGAHPAYVEMAGELMFAGVPASFSVSWTDAAALDSFRIRVIGGRGSATLDLERSRTAYFEDPTGRPVEGHGVKSTYERFVDAVRSGVSGTPGVTEALAAQETLENLLSGVPT